jgi:hypothetical protein
VLALAFPTLPSVPAARELWAPPEMNEDLTGDDLLLLIEALDAFMPPHGSLSVAWGSSPPWTDEQMARYGPFALLRYRLAQAVGMGFYDTGRTFLDAALRDERYALTDALHGRMTTLLKDAALRRGEFRAGMIRAFQELRDVRYYKVKAALEPLNERSTPG